MCAISVRKKKFKCIHFGFLSSAVCRGLLEQICSRFRALISAGLESFVHLHLVRYFLFCIGIGWMHLKVSRFDCRLRILDYICHGFYSFRDLYSGNLALFFLTNITRIPFKHSSEHNCVRTYSMHLVSIYSILHRRGRFSIEYGLLHSGWS